MGGGGGGGVEFMKSVQLRPKLNNSLICTLKAMPN